MYCFAPNESMMLDGLRVLVVDDDPDTRELLVVTLRLEGVEAIAAASTCEAIEVMERLQPDLLISDIQMPGEDGYALIRKVRTLDAEVGRQTPAIAVTAWVREEDCTQTLAAGFQSYLSKPVALDELIAVVANLALLGQEFCSGVMSQRPCQSYHRHETSAIPVEDR